jgi:hypothetical protein
MNSLTAIQISLDNSLIYREFIEERKEILKHKWIESEKKGYDIGFDKAFFEWIMKYRAGWRKKWRLFNI